MTGRRDDEATRRDDEATEYGILTARIAELEDRMCRLEEIAEILPPRARQLAFGGLDGGDLR